MRVDCVGVRVRWRMYDVRVLVATKVRNEDGTDTNTILL